MQPYAWAQYYAEDPWVLGLRMSSVGVRAGRRAVAVVAAVEESVDLCVRCQQTHQ